MRYCFVHIPYRTIPYHTTIITPSLAEATPPRNGQEDVHSKEIADHVVTWMPTDDDPTPIAVLIVNLGCRVLRVVTWTGDVAAVAVVVTVMGQSSSLLVGRIQPWHISS